MRQPFADQAVQNALKYAAIELAKPYPKSVDGKDYNHPRNGVQRPNHANAHNVRVVGLVGDFLELAVEHGKDATVKNKFQTLQTNEQAKLQEAAAFLIVGRTGETSREKDTDINKRCVAQYNAYKKPAAADNYSNALTDPFLHGADAATHKAAEVIDAQHCDDPLLRRAVLNGAHMLDLGRCKNAADMDGVRNNMARCLGYGDGTNGYQNMPDAAKKALNALFVKSQVQQLLTGNSITATLDSHGNFVSATVHHQDFLFKKASDPDICMRLVALAEHMKDDPALAEKVALALEHAAKQPNPQAFENLLKRIEQACTPQLQPAVAAAVPVPVPAVGAPPPDPKKAAIALAITPTGFKPFRVDYEKTKDSVKLQQDAIKQAKIILNEVKRLRDLGATQVGITYSANQAQAEGLLGKAGNKGDPNHSITGANQAAVMQAAQKLINTDQDYQNLKDVFRIVPLATMQYKNENGQEVAHHADPAVVAQCKKNAEEFVEKPGHVLLGWKNQDSKNSFAVGGGVAKEKIKDPGEQRKAEQDAIAYQELLTTLNKNHPYEANATVIEGADVFKHLDADAKKAALAKVDAEIKTDKALTDMGATVSSASSTEEKDVISTKIKITFKDEPEKELTVTRTAHGDGTVTRAGGDDLKPEQRYAIWAALSYQERVAAAVPNPPDTGIQVSLVGAPPFPPQRPLTDDETKLVQAYLKAGLEPVQCAGETFDKNNLLGVRQIQEGKLAQEWRNKHAVCPPKKPRTPGDEPDELVEPPPGP